MQALKWSFKPAMIPTVATTIAFSILIYLGYWQLQRAEQKENLYRSYIQKRSLEPANLNLAANLQSNTDDILWRKVIITGHYYDGATYLLDNQIEDSIPGYHVYSPFVINDTNTLVMINRGWIAGEIYRDKVPEIFTFEGLLTLHGDVVMPQQNLFLGRTATEKFSNNISRVQEIRISDIEKNQDYNILPYNIRLAPSSPSGFSRKWQEPGSGRETHLGYAFQWFMLSVVLLVYYFACYIKRH